MILDKLGLSECDLSVYLELLLILGTPTSVLAAVLARRVLSRSTIYILLALLV